MKMMMTRIVIIRSTEVLILGVTALRVTGSNRITTLSTIIGRAVSIGRMRIMTVMMTAMTGFGTRENFDNNDFRFLI